MKRNKLKLNVITLAILSFVLCGTISCSDSRAVEQGVNPMTVPYIVPITEKVDNWDEYIGRFAASERVEVRSRVNGYVASVNFKDGDIVKKGQVLFVIDQRPFYIAVKQAEAEKLKAEADFKRMTSDYNRIAAVQDSRAVSIEEVEQRQQIARSAEAQLMVAKAQLSQAKLELSYTEIKAPITGKISDDFVDQGNYITAGVTPLTTVLTINPIHFYFEGSDVDFSFLNKEGKDVELPVEVKISREDSFSRHGVMDFVDNEIDQNTGTMRARAVFDNPNLELESGMFGRIRLIKEKTSAILIPDEAIGSNQSQKIVYIIGDDSTVHIKPVQPGKLYNQKYRIINSGLSPSDKVITGNLLKIGPGTKVTPKQNEFNINPDTTSLALKKP